MKREADGPSKQEEEQMRGAVRKGIICLFTSNSDTPRRIEYTSNDSRQANHTETLRDSQV